MGFDPDLAISAESKFDLKRYETHIEAHIQNLPVSLEQIPPLSQENARKDRIWRFIAIIFLAHSGVINVWQDGQDIMVSKHEVDRKRQNIYGELEEADGFQGSFSRAKA